MLRSPCAVTAQDERQRSADDDLLDEPGDPRARFQDLGQEADTFVADRERFGLGRRYVATIDDGAAE